MKNSLFLTSLLLVLTACAGSPLKMDGVDQTVTPAMVNADHPHAGLRVAWGGIIVRSEPLETQTRIEVLAYPLDRYGKPNAGTTSQGRFLILHKGFLEPSDYAPGRWLSVVGRVGKSQTGSIGGASYRFPVVVAEQLQLWPKDSGSRTDTHFHFGIGIQF